MRIAQIVSNLLTNAAKYTPADGRVQLLARREGDEVVLECRDNGMGIPPALRPHVFELFVQGPRGLDRRQGGLGLGLGVARTLTELHGGTIAVASDGQDRGSTFTVRLPFASSPASAIVTTVHHAAAAPQLPLGPVLVVDDNRDALDTLVAALRHGGFAVIAASTPQQAIELAGRAAPQVAVLDIGLPDMNGFDLARALRERCGGSLLRVIAVTGYGRQQDVAAAQAAGFDRFFVKPVDVALLIDAVNQPLRTV
jgi:CheY-like chemotaxis protein